jgi:hypothetical protein
MTKKISAEKIVPTVKIRVMIGNSEHELSEAEARELKDLLVGLFGDSTLSEQIEKIKKLIKDEKHPYYPPYIPNPHPVSPWSPPWKPYWHGHEIMCRTSANSNVMLALSTSGTNAGTL